MGSANNNKLKDSTESSAKNIKALKKALNFGGAYLAIKRVGGAMWNLAQANVDMIEANNLFEVSMGKVVDEYGNLIVMNNVEDNGDAFELKYLDIQDIVVPDRIRHNNNIDALKISVRSTGLIAPITVAPTATEGVYALINGLQRLMACAKTGIRRIPCVINKNAIVFTYVGNEMEVTASGYVPYNSRGGYVSDNVC